MRFPPETSSGPVIFAFRKGFWGSVSGGIAGGGKTTVSGVEKDNYQNNSRFAATLAVPINKRLSARAFYINSVKTALGADFDLYNISLQYTWGGGFWFDESRCSGKGASRFFASVEDLLVTECDALSPWRRRR